MKNFEATMFNKKAADPRNRPDQIVEALVLQLSQNIVDIGVGCGYFSLRFADIVGGREQVYIGDTNQDFLEFIKYQANERGLYNVTTILATEGKVALPKQSVNLIFMRNVYHHLPNCIEYMRNFKDALELEGRITVIEYNRSSIFSFRRIFGHYVSQEQIIKEMKEAEYHVDQVFHFLPDQSFTFFS